jgi:predicted ArsR family transcriptional regulator
MSHPLRLRILAMVTARPVSATEVAQVAGVGHAAASYHLRQLAKGGLLRAVPNPTVAGRRGRGRPQQRYAMRPDAFRGLAPPAARLLERQLLSELGRKLAQRGTKRITDAEVWLTPVDLKRLRALTAEGNKIVHSKALPPGARRSKHVSLTSVLLEYLT